MHITMKNLTVKSLDEKIILNDFNLNIKSGETHVIMGPNGTGKSTLSKTILGSNDYNVISGDIIVDNTSIITMPTDERARLGIFLANQSPISIEGVTNSEFLRTALSSITKEKVGIYQFMKEMNSCISDLQMDPAMMHRAINKDFSGGERKKNEILQMKILKPKFIILDELDSGLDVDSLKIVCNNINKYKEEHPDTSILMITHYPRILEYIEPNFIHVMLKGKIVKSGTKELAFEIEKKGYEVINTMEEASSYE